MTRPLIREEGGGGMGDYFFFFWRQNGWGVFSREKKKIIFILSR